MDKGGCRSCCCSTHAVTFCWKWTAVFRNQSCQLVRAAVAVENLNLLHLDYHTYFFYLRIKNAAHVLVVGLVVVSGMQGRRSGRVGVVAARPRRRSRCRDGHICNMPVDKLPRYVAAEK